MTSRVLAFAGVACVLASSVSAQSFEELPRKLKVGQTVSVTDDAGRKITGKLAELSTSSLELLIGSDRHPLGADSVRTITQRQRNTGRGAKWGFLAGAALAIVGVIRGSSTTDCSVVDCEGLDSPLFVIPFVGFMGGLGAGVGAGIGAMSTRERLIYRAPGAATSKRFEMYPAVISNQIGVGASIRF